MALDEQSTQISNGIYSLKVNLKNDIIFKTLIFCYYVIFYDSYVHVVQSMPLLLGLAMPTPSVASIIACNFSRRLGIFPVTPNAALYAIILRFVKPVFEPGP